MFTVGDTSRNLDLAVVVGSQSDKGVVASIVSPDDVSGNSIRSDELEVAFTGLTPGRAISIATDLDRDSVDSTEDFTKIFFNNGSLPNSQIRVEFSDGRVFSMTLPDGTAPGNLFVFNQ